MKKWQKQIAMYGVLVVLLTAFCCLGESFIERLRAEELLRLLANVDIGAVRSPALTVQLEKFTRYQSSSGSMNGRSFDQYMFQNNGFAFLGLAPSKILWVQIDFKDGLVVEKSAHFAEAPNRGAVVTEDAGMENPINTQLAPPIARKVEERGSFTDSTYMLSVRDGIGVPEDRRRMDWMLDVSCMTRLGSCGDFRKILRGAFE